MTTLLLTALLALTPAARSGETGEHIQDARNEIQWIPFPMCNETGKPLEFHYVHPSQRSYK